MRLMADGLWVSGKSHEVVAKQFGVAPATVKDWATSASRVLRLILEQDKEEIRARMIATLENVVAESMKTVKPVTVRKELTRKGKRVSVSVTEMLPAPSLQAAVSAVLAQAQLLGLVSQKLDVTTRPSVAHLSREEHAQELEKLSTEIATELSRLKSEGT